MKKEYIKSVGKSICSRCKKVFGNAVIYCLSCDGNEIWSFSDPGFEDSTPAIADIDNDNKFEIVVGCMTCKILCLGLTNIQESGLKPWSTFRGSIFRTGSADSDSDFLDDVTEDYYKCSPNDDDSDNDRLKDGEEVLYYATNPANIDSDNDLLFDGDEVQLLNTLPNNPDSDTDQLPDGFEFYNYLDPLDSSDAAEDLDNDNLSNLEEYLLKTDLGNNDSDGDELLDGEEINDYFTNPLDIDSDDDQLIDGSEAHGIYSPSNPGANATGYVHTDPLNSDSDGDTYIDSVEIFSNSDPNNPLSKPEPLTVTPPPETITIPETITQNNTITTTVEAGIIFTSVILSTTIGITIAVVIYRKRQE